MMTNKCRTDDQRNVDEAKNARLSPSKVERKTLAAGLVFQSPTGTWRIETITVFKDLDGNLASTVTILSTDNSTRKVVDALDILKSFEKGLSKEVVTTVCGHDCGAQFKTPWKQWILGNSDNIPRKRHGRSNFCIVCFKATNHNLPWYENR